MTAAFMRWPCCTHCSCGDDWEVGHADPCDLGCGGFTVLNDHGVTVAEVDAYAAALADRDRARSIAVALEQQLHAAVEAVRELSAGHRLPSEADVHAAGSRSRWTGRCWSCDRPWPCPSFVTRQRVLKVFPEESA